MNPELIKRNSDSDQCVECGITLEKCTSDGDKECYSFHSDDNRLLGCYSQAGLCGAARTSLENGHFRLPYFTDNIDSQGISRNRLMELTGRLAIPTIVVNEKVIGGYTELTRLYG